MKLYEYSVSRSLRCHWMLKEIGVKFETEIVDMQKGGGQAPEFLKIHPLGKVPALVDGDFTLWESAAILSYLGDKYPEKNLIPKAGTYDRAHYDQWMAYALTELDSILWTRAKHTFVIPEEFRAKEKVDKASEWEFKKNVKALENELAGKDYILGTQFTAADIMLGHTLMWASNIEGYLDDCPNATAYMNRLREREHFPREMYKD